MITTLVLLTGLAVGFLVLYSPYITWLALLIATKRDCRGKFLRYSWFVFLTPILSWFAHAGLYAIPHPPSFLIRTIIWMDVVIAVCACAIPIVAFMKARAVAKSVGDQAPCADRSRMVSGEGLANVVAVFVGINVAGLLLSLFAVGAVAGRDILASVDMQCLRSAVASSWLYSLAFTVAMSLVARQVLRPLVRRLLIVLLAAGSLLFFLMLSGLVFEIRQVGGGMFAVMPDYAAFGPLELHQERIAKRLRDKELKEIRTLRDRGSPDDEKILLDKLANTKDWRTTYTPTIVALGERRCTNAVAPLLALLESHRKNGACSVIHDAVWALGKIGDRRALPALEKYYAETQKGWNEEYMSMTLLNNPRALQEAIREIKENNKGLNGTP